MFLPPPRSTFLSCSPCHLRFHALHSLHSIPSRRLAQGGKLDLALHTLRRMRSDPSRYPAPNTVCYNAALMALMRRGRWREARGLLTEVAATSRAAAAGVSGEGEDREGEGEGGVAQGAQVLDFLSYNSVIRACAAAGEAKEVSQSVAG